MHSGVDILPSRETVSAMGAGEADPEQIERNRHRNGQRGRIEDCRPEGDILFFLRDEEHTERKDQKIHARDVHSGVAGNDGLIGEQPGHKRKPEEADVSEHGANGQNPVFGDLVPAVQDEVQDADEQQLCYQTDAEELPRLGKVRRGIFHRLKRRKNQAGGADIQKQTRKGPRMIRVGFFRFHQHKPARHVKQHD